MTQKPIDVRCRCKSEPENLQSIPGEKFLHLNRCTELKAFLALMEIIFCFFLECNSAL
jgi:hypothetical protein